MDFRVPNIVLHTFRHFYKLFQNPSYFADSLIYNNAVNQNENLKCSSYFHFCIYCIYLVKYII